MSAIKTISRLRTPDCIVIESRLDRNVSEMAAKAKAATVKLRPHVKTHKSPAIGYKQAHAGAIGLTAATVDETLTFLMAGFESILLACPQVHPDALRLLMHTARQYKAEVILAVDSPATVELAATIAGEMQDKFRVYLIIDVGLGRCGIDPQSEESQQLLRLIASFDSLDLTGIMSHAGHAYGARSTQEILAIANAERVAMLTFQQVCVDVTGRRPLVSVGATPTLLAGAGLEGIDEIRPGNYVFRDLTMTTLGVAPIASCALAVLSRVLTLRKDRVIIDAGSKALSSDRGAHGSDAIEGFGLVVPVEAHLNADYSHFSTVERLSEEHGFVKRTAAIDWRVGMLVAVIPNHACTAANLAPMYHVVREDGDLHRWPLSARRSADWDISKTHPTR